MRDIQNIKKLTSPRFESGVVKSSVKPTGPLASINSVMYCGVAPFTERKDPFNLNVLSFYKQNQFLTNQYIDSKMYNRKKIIIHNIYI